MNKIIATNESDMVPVISSLLQRMSTELNANEGKGDFYHWDPSIDQVMSELNHHSDKLKNALFDMRRGKENSNLVSELAADIANYCAKVHQLYGEFHFEPARKPNNV